MKAGKPLEEEVDPVGTPFALPGSYSSGNKVSAVAAMLRSRTQAQT